MVDLGEEIRAINQLVDENQYLKSSLDKMFKKSENDEAVAFAQREKTINLEKNINPEILKLRAEAHARVMSVIGIDEYREKISKINFSPAKGNEPQKKLKKH